MGTQTTTIEVAADVVELLHAGASARHLSLNNYLRTLAEENPATAPPLDRTLEVFDRDMDALSDGLEHLPPLPRDFSRADIYKDVEA
jgi:hypothetical protein